MNSEAATEHNPGVEWGEKHWTNFIQPLEGKTVVFNKRTYKISVEADDGVMSYLTVRAPLPEKSWVAAVCAPDRSLLLREERSLSIPLTVQMFKHTPTTRDSSGVDVTVAAHDNASRVLVKILASVDAWLKKSAHAASELDPRTSASAAWLRMLEQFRTRKSTMNVFGIDGVVGLFNSVADGVLSVSGKYNGEYFHAMIDPRNVRDTKSKEQKLDLHFTTNRPGHTISTTDFRGPLLISAADNDKTLLLKAMKSLGDALHEFHTRSDDEEVEAAAELDPHEDDHTWKVFEELVQALRQRQPLRVGVVVLTAEFSFAGSVEGARVRVRSDDYAGFYDLGIVYKGSRRMQYNTTGAHGRILGNVGTDGVKDAKGLLKIILRDFTERIAEAEKVRRITGAAEAVPDPTVADLERRFLLKPTRVQGVWIFNAFGGSGFSVSWVSGPGGHALTYRIKTYPTPDVITSVVLCRSFKEEKIALPPNPTPAQALAVIIRDFKKRVPKPVTASAESEIRNNDNWQKAAREFLWKSTHKTGGFQLGMITQQSTKLPLHIRREYGGFFLYVGRPGYGEVFFEAPRDDSEYLEFGENFGNGIQRHSYKIIPDGNTPIKFAQWLVKNAVLLINMGSSRPIKVQGAVEPDTNPEFFDVAAPADLAFERLCSHRRFKRFRNLGAPIQTLSIPTSHPVVVDYVNGFSSVLVIGNIAFIESDITPSVMYCPVETTPSGKFAGLKFPAYPAVTHRDKVKPMDLLRELVQKQKQLSSSAHAHASAEPEMNNLQKWKALIKSVSGKTFTVRGRKYEVQDRPHDPDVLWITGENVHGRFDFATISSGPTLRCEVLPGHMSSRYSEESLKNFLVQAPMFVPFNPTTAMRVILKDLYDSDSKTASAAAEPEHKATLENIAALVNHSVEELEFTYRGTKYTARVSGARFKNTPALSIGVYVATTEARKGKSVHLVPWTPFELRGGVSKDTIMLWVGGHGTVSEAGSVPVSTARETLMRALALCAKYVDEHKTTAASSFDSVLGLPAGSCKFNNGRVDVDGDVNLSGRGLTRFPCLFGRVRGNFDCSNNNLTSLAGSPLRVHKSFNCSNNQLTSLHGSPVSVGGDFDCRHNHIATLKGSPKHISGTLDCSDNNIANLFANVNCKVLRCHGNKLRLDQAKPAGVGELDLGKQVSL